jgi:putative DNA primase/helicase
MDNYIEEFWRAIADTGQHPPDTIIDDGKIHRYGRNKNCWYVLFGDGIPAGAFGDWSEGTTHKWCSKQKSEFTLAEQSAFNKRMKEVKKANEVEQLRSWEECCQKADEYLKDSAPASPEHPYLKTKQVQPNGIRQQLLATSKLGPVLYVSAQDIDGKVWSLQKIMHNGEKRFLTGGRKKGCFHLIGSLDSPLVICEGFATGASIHESTGLSVVVAFDAGNLQLVATAIRSKHPQLEITIAADDDWKIDGNPGITKATTAAQAVGGKLAVPVWEGERPEKSTDFNDLQMDEGQSVVQRLILNPREPVTLTDSASIQFYEFLIARDLNKLHSLSWRVKPLLPSHGVAAIYGPSGSGKTFLTIDLAVSMCEGTLWFGHKTRAAQVVYIALEGEYGLSIRTKALERYRGRPISDRLRFVTEDFNFSNEEDVDRLTRSIDQFLQEQCVVIVDTYNRATTGLDENSVKDTGVVLHRIKHLLSSTKGLVILVHHTGKDSSRGMRGSSALFAALDAVIEVKANADGRRSWVAEKVKDGQTGVDHAFRLDVVELDPDDDGDPVTSCVVVEDGTAKPVQTSQKSLSRSQQFCLKTFRSAGKRYAKKGSGLAGVELRDWREVFHAMATHDNLKSKDQAFRRGRNELVELEILQVHNDIYWEINKPEQLFKERRQTLQIGDMSPDVAYDGTGDRRHDTTHPLGGVVDVAVVADGGQSSREVKARKI